MKTKEEIFEFVKIFLAKENSVDQINLEDKWGDDLGLDSLDLIEIVMALEKETGVLVTDSALAKVITIDNLINAVYDIQ